MKKYITNANQGLKYNHRENNLIFQILFKRYMPGDLGQIASSFFLAMTTIIGFHWESQAGGKAASLTLTLSRDIPSLRGATEAICLNKHQVKISNWFKPVVLTINSIFKSALLFAVAFFLLFASELAMAQKKATWIWYPGDYDIWLGNKMQNRRTERGTFFPPFWKMDSHYVLVEFSKKFDLETEETVSLKVEG